MTESLSGSLVLAMDYRVPDPARVWPLLRRHRSALAELGAHHVLVYSSAADRGRMLVLMAIRGVQPVADLLRDEVFMQWFDAVGVTDIPAVFAGSLVERIDLTEPLAEPLGSCGGPSFASPSSSLAEPLGSSGGPSFASPSSSLAEPPGVVVAAVAEVADTGELINHVHGTVNQFKAAGIRKILVFQAFDNPREVFLLQQADDEAGAARWINQPAFAADWITKAGVGVYPPVFVGRLQHLMRTDDGNGPR